MARTPLVHSHVFVATLTAAATAHAQRAQVVVVGPRPAGPPVAVGVAQPAQPMQPPRGRAVVVQPGGAYVPQPPQGGVVVQQPGYGYGGRPQQGGVVVQPGYVPQPPQGGVVVQQPGYGYGGRPQQGGVVVQPGYVQQPPQGGVVVQQPGYGYGPRPQVIVAQPGGGRPMFPGPARVPMAPPAVRVDAPAMPPPAAGYVWIPGYNHWNGGSYYWVAGHWELPPQQGVVWIGPRTVQRGGAVDWYPGYWSTPEYVQSYVPEQGYSETPLQIGSSVQGMLQYGDRTLQNGALANDYLVTLAPGQAVSIAVHGGPSWTTPGGRLDPMVQVLGYNGYQNGANEYVLAQDDDSGGGQDSRLIFTAPSGGTYRVRVTTFGGGMNQGYYTINTRYGVQPYGL